MKLRFLSGALVNCILIMLFQGRTVCMPVIQETRVVALVDWFARVVNQAFTVPKGKINDNRVLGVAKETPMWTLDELKDELEKMLPKEQVCHESVNP